MKTAISAGLPKALPAVGGVATAPTTEENTRSLPSGADFLSLISQVYSGASASRIPNGDKRISESAGPGEPAQELLSADALSASNALLPAGSTSSASSLLGENTGGARSRIQNPVTKNSTAPDEAMTSSAMVLLAQTAVLPKPEPDVKLKPLATGNLSVGDSLKSNGAATGAINPETPVSATSGKILPLRSDAGSDNTQTPLKVDESASIPTGTASAASAVNQNGANPPNPANSSITGVAGILTPTEPAITQAAVIQSQVVGKHISENGRPKVVGTVSRDGTGVALNKERMDNAAEKNEIAGRAVKKLPRDAQARDFSGGSATADSSRANSDAAATKKESLELNLPQGLETKAAAAPVEPAAPLEKTASSAAAQVEHVARLVTQEAATVRQSGATSLAVSLKVDSHTQLFLQLSNHGGQMQASLRLDRGSLEGLGNHWNDLQESLGRQNIQLLPLTSNNLSSAPSARTTLEANGGSAADSSAFQQSPGNFRRQTSEPQEVPLPTGDGITVAKPKQKTGATALKGWESWA